MGVGDEFSGGILDLLLKGGLRSSRGEGRKEGRGFVPGALIYLERPRFPRTLLSPVTRLFCRLLMIVYLSNAAPDVPMNISELQLPPSNETVKKRKRALIGSFIC